MSIVQNKERVANFTSSEIYRLTGIGNRLMTAQELKLQKESNPKSKKRTIACSSVVDEKFNTYVKEKYYETKLKRSLSTDAYSKPLAWGNLIEHYVFSLMGLDYELVSNKTFMHPTISHWSGSPDMRKQKELVVDIKAYQLKKYCEYYEVLEKQDVDLYKKEYPQEYWQLVSNAAINETPNAEAIIYMPKYSEAEEIKDLAETFGTWEYRYVYESIEANELYKLPLLPNDSYYAKNGNMMRFNFEVPVKDIKFLENRVQLAAKEMNNLLNK